MKTRRSIRAASLAAAVAAVATTSCFDLDSFVMNPKHCSVGYSDDDCRLKKLCTPCGEDFPFADFGVPPELATRHPIALDDGETNDAWFLAAAPGSESPFAGHTIVFSHGNFGGIEHYLNRAVLLWELGANVFVVDYRGFGHSSDASEATEVQFMADTASAWAFVPEVLAAHGLDPAQPVSIYGYSAGALSAVEMAVLEVPEGGGGSCSLILEAPWPSIEAFSRTSSFIGIPGTFVTTGEWDNISKMATYDGPYLHLHGGNDATVQPALGEELFEATASSQKDFVLVDGASHGNFLDIGADSVEPDVPEVLGHAAYLERVGTELRRRCNLR